MRPPLRALCGGLWLATACTNGAPTVNNSPPAVAWLEPANQSRVAADSPLTLRVSVRDPEQPLEELALVWSVDGELTLSDDTASLTLPDGLSAGEHTLSLLVTDAEGDSGEAAVSIEAVANEAPAVQFLLPASGTVLAERPLELLVEVSDADSPVLSTLTLSWSGLADVPQAPLHPDDDGLARLQLTDLALGDGFVALSVTDGAGATASASVALTVIASDADGDGVPAIAWGGTDCNDTDPTVFPGADETCDGVDEDCDGSTDEGATDTRPWYADADGDGHGDPASAQVACTPPAGTVEEGDDCDDARDDVYPGAPEACDGRDNSCSGVADDGPGLPWYRDSDGDGHGDAADRVDACDQPAGRVSSNDDCDDADAATFPGAAERCDGADNDCDGSVPVGERTDGDGDGWPLCDDCLDADRGVNPGADEVCDGVDQDCSGLADDGDVCPCAVEWHGGSAYQFCTTPRTWWEARDACAATGYALASLNSATEDDWVYDAINQRSFGYWWVGLQRSGSTFVWLDGSSVSGFSNWGPAEPNNLYGDEDCGELNRFTLDSPAHTGWNDQKCDSEWAFVCEAP